MTRNRFPDCGFVVSGEGERDERGFEPEMIWLHGGHAVFGQSRGWRCRSARPPHTCPRRLCTLCGCSGSRSRATSPPGSPRAKDSWLTHEEADDMVPGNGSYRFGLVDESSFNSRCLEHRTPTKTETPGGNGLRMADGNFSLGPSTFREPPACAGRLSFVLN